MYHEILLAVTLQQWEEFTPHALAARDAAVALTRGAGAKLSVLSVYEYGRIDEPGLSPDMAARYREDKMRRIDALMETKMKNLLANVEEAGIPITSIMEAGEPRKIIIALAERLGADLLVIGAHRKRTIFDDVVLGGTAASVSRHAPCPVVMVKPRASRQGPATV
jgi:nucleotide-binding universal stress UspA family protein